MRIEEAIQIENFENIYHKTEVNLLYTYGWLNNLSKSIFEKHNITVQQFNILRILRGQDSRSATVNLLKERMIDKMPDASRMVDRLVQKGLILRCVNTKDHRAADLRISDPGLDILLKMDTEAKTHDLFKDNLTYQEARQLSNLLDKLRG